MTRRPAPAAPSFDRIPTPDELGGDPELAILVALDLTLELTTRALACAHPELLDPERPYWLGSPTRAATIAKTLVRRTRALQRALRAYREAVELPRQDQAAASRNRDELPF
jgi:hypothetical protein